MKKNDMFNSIVHIVALSLLCTLGCTERDGQSPLKDVPTGCPLGSLYSAKHDECIAEECGNGRVELDGACDDGNRVSEDGCRADCSSLEPTKNSTINEPRCQNRRQHAILPATHSGNESSCAATLSEVRILKSQFQETVDELNRAAASTKPVRRSTLRKQKRLRAQIAEAQSELDRLRRNNRKLRKELKEARGKLALRTLKSIGWAIDEIW